jgi:serine/threonine protein kinase
VPIRSAFGELLGAILVPSRAEAFSHAEERLVLGFAHQLGSTMELRRTREELAMAITVRSARQQELRDRGVELLEICPVCQRCYGHAAGTCTEDGAALQAPASFLPFRIQGKYRLERVLGEGGMGTVFAAVDERLDRRVAVKVLRLDRFGDRDSLLRFQREARTLAQIDHPSVTEIYDTGEMEEGSMFIVMELLHGVDLGSLVRTFGRATPAQAARVLRQASDGLEAAHRQRIVHRDIKPENLLLTDGPSGFQTKVLDFGLAKKIGSQDVTQTGVVVGSPHYMSPEQARGRAAGPLSDFYSLATVIYEILTGRRTVETADASDVGSILYEVMITIPPPPSDFVPGLSPRIDELFAWALGKNPQSRPQQASDWVPELAAELERVPESTPGWPEDLAALSSTPRTILSGPKTRAI